MRSSFNFSRFFKSKQAIELLLGLINILCSHELSSLSEQFLEKKKLQDNEGCVNGNLLSILRKLIKMISLVGFFLSQECRDNKLHNGTQCDNGKRWYMT